MTTNGEDRSEMTPERARALLEKATAGPWVWRGEPTRRDSIPSHPYLTSRAARYFMVMDFARQGMNSAQPRFRTGPDDFSIMQKVSEIGFGWERHPDAALIAAAPDLARLVLAQADELASLRMELANLRSGQVDRPILTWMAGTDSGASSESLASCHLGLTPRFGWMEPADSADFGRCYRLLVRFPEVRSCVDKLAQKHTGWAKLAPIWDELMQMAREDGLEQRDRFSKRIDLRIRGARWPALAPTQEPS
jgi:hypothetical protein